MANEVIPGVSFVVAVVATYVILWVNVVGDGLIAVVAVVLTAEVDSLCCGCCGSICSAFCVGYCCEC